MRSSCSTLLSRSDGSGGYFGDDNLLIRRTVAKEAVEKEVVRFSLDKLNASVEVVGVVVSYSEDAIARRPVLNPFSLTCDLCVTPTADEIDFEEFASGAVGGSSSSRVLSHVHDKKATASTAYTVVCKFFRDRRSRGEWFLHTICERGSVRSSINATLAECMQVFMLDIIPEIEIPNRNGLTSVASICAALSCDEFLGIERYFPDTGLHKPQFARIILYSLLLARPELRHPARAAAIIALLFELFEQIDINGDAVVDWDEFTTFCISLGLIATHDAPAGGDDTGSEANTSDGASAHAAALYQQQTPRGQIRTRCAASSTVAMDAQTFRIDLSPNIELCL